MNPKEKLKFIHRFTPILYDLALGLMCVYIWFRGRQWLNLLLPFGTGWALGILLAAYYIANLLCVNHVKGMDGKIPTYITSIGTVAAMYLTMTIALGDLLRWGLHFFVDTPQILAFLFLVEGAVCLLVTVGAVAYGLCHARKLRTVHYQLPLTGLSQDTRLVLLSDLHIGHFIGPKHIQKLVTEINHLKPDVVVISGDMMNAGSATECPQVTEVAKILGKMKSQRGTFAVTGNHDPEPENPDFQRFLRRSKIHLLEDQVLTTSQFHLVGRSTRVRPRKDLTTLLEGMPKDRPILVLDHDPIGIQEAREQGCQCVLCGHTHKGQIFPLNLLVSFLYPKEQLWGMGTKDGTTSIVSAGAGYFSMPVRLGSDTEIVCIDLKA